MSTMNPQEYYENENNQGSYQFTFLEDLVNNFMLNYSGNDTLLGKIERDRVVSQMKFGIREFTFSMLHQAKVVELELTDTYDIIIPFDYVEYIRISWVNKATGKIHPMSVNKNTPLGIAKLQDNNAEILFDNDGYILEGSTVIEAVNDALVNPPIEQITQFPMYPNIGFGTRYDIEQQWNLDPSKNFNGTFNIDNKRIHFSTDSKDRVILLEYVSDGLGAGESEMCVHKFAEDALYAYVHYNLCKNSIKMPNYEKINVKKEFDRLYRNAKVRMLKIKPQELIATMRAQKAWIR